jgi:hypothetical protein
LTGGPEADREAALEAAENFGAACPPKSEKTRTEPGTDVMILEIVSPKKLTKIVV